MYVKKKESANFLVIQQISKTSHGNISLKMTILIHLLMLVTDQKTKV